MLRRGSRLLSSWMDPAIVRACRPACSCAAFLAIAVLIVSCDGPPGRPSHLDYFRLAGPGEVAPGTSVPFKALLDKSATLSDASAEAQWISSNPSVLSIDAGLATGRIAGEVTVTARLGELQTDPKLVLVLPVGTYRLRGRVLIEGSNPSVALAMARVEVPAVGLSTTTDTQGRYTLYGVPPDAELRVTRDGFAPTSVTVHLQDHDQVITTSLRTALSGTYTLTISPGNCSNGPPLPANLLHRTYTTVFVQTGSQIRGTFPNPNITVVIFIGAFSPAQARWNFSFTIGERLPDGNAVTFNGSAFVRTADFAGEFNGRIALNDPSAEDAIARCDATGFRFALTQ
jgi:hypothetical protein